MPPLYDNIADALVSIQDGAPHTISLDCQGATFENDEATNGEGWEGVWIKIDLSSYDVEDVLIPISASKTGGDAGFAPYIDVMNVVDVTFNPAAPDFTKLGFAGGFGNQYLGDGTDTPSTTLTLTGGTGSSAGSASQNGIFYLIFTDWNFVGYGVADVTYEIPIQPVVYICDAVDYINTGSSTTSVVSGAVRDTQYLVTGSNDGTWLADGNTGTFGSVETDPTTTFTIEGDCLPPNGLYSLQLKFRWGGSGNSNNDSANVLIKRNGLPLLPFSFLPETTPLAIGTEVWVPITDTEHDPNTYAYFDGPPYIPILSTDTIEVCVFYWNDFPQTARTRHPEILQSKLTLVSSGGSSTTPVQLLDGVDHPIGTTDPTNYPDHIRAYFSSNPSTRLYSHDIAVMDNGDIYIAWLISDGIGDSYESRINMDKWNSSSNTWSQIAVADDINPAGTFTGLVMSMCTDGEDVFIAWAEKSGEYVPNSDWPAGDSGSTHTFGPGTNENPIGASNTFNGVRVDSDDDFVYVLDGLALANSNPSSAARTVSGTAPEDCDVHIVVGARPNDGEGMGVMARVLNKDTSTPSAYEIRGVRNDSTGDELQLIKWISGTATVINTNVYDGVSEVNSKFGMRWFGTNWVVYADIGSGWVAVDYGTDSSITTSSSYGIRIESGAITTFVFGVPTFAYSYQLRVKKYDTSGGTFSDVGTPFASRVWQPGDFALIEGTYKGSVLIRCSPAGVPWVGWGAISADWDNWFPFLHYFNGTNWIDSEAPWPVNPHASGNFIDVCYIDGLLNDQFIQFTFCHHDGPSEWPSLCYNVRYGWTDSGDIASATSLAYEFYYYEFDGATWDNEIKFNFWNYWTNAADRFENVDSDNSYGNWSQGLSLTDDGVRPYLVGAVGTAFSDQDGVWALRMKDDGDWEKAHEYALDSLSQLWASSNVRSIGLGPGRVAVVINSFYTDGLVVTFLDEPGTGQGSMAAMTSRNAVGHGMGYNAAHRVAELNGDLFIINDGFDYNGTQNVAYPYSDIELFPWHIPESIDYYSPFTSTPGNIHLSRIRFRAFQQGNV